MNEKRQLIWLLNTNKESKQNKISSSEQKTEDDENHQYKKNFFVNNEPPLSKAIEISKAKKFHKARAQAQKVHNKNIVANKNREIPSERQHFRNSKKMNKKSSVSNLRNIPQIDLTELLKEKIKNHPKQIYSINNSHHIKYPKAVMNDPLMRGKLPDNDLVLYTKQIPNYSYINQKNNEMITTRAHQISNLKEKLKLK